MNCFSLIKISYELQILKITSLGGAENFPPLAETSQRLQSFHPYTQKVITSLPELIARPLSCKVYRVAVRCSGSCRKGWWNKYTNWMTSLATTRANLSMRYRLTNTFKLSDSVEKQVYM